MEVMEVIKYCGTSNRNGENRNKKKKNSSGVKRMNLLWRLFSLIMSLSLILKHENNFFFLNKSVIGTSCGRIDNYRIIC